MGQLNKKIILTGDIHHMSMNGFDQKIFSHNQYSSEVELCEPYLEISNTHNFIPVLFFTGMSIKKEYEKINILKSKYDFVIGGHTYSAYRPKLFHKTINKLFKSQFISRRHQENDILKTRNAAIKFLNTNILHWRNHAYCQDDNTVEILDRLEFEFISNDVDLKKFFPEKLGKTLTSFPINTIPDHENLPHSVDHSGGYDINDWSEKNIDIVKKIINLGGVATILAHPLCMYLEDSFHVFNIFLKKLSEIEY